MSRTRPAWVALAVVALGLFYYVGATEHARRVNTERGRADQSGYLWDAVGIYQMRHGGDPILIGERNRMPVYPWLLSWLYDPAMSPDEFFEVAKRWNIRLSLALLAGYAFFAFRMLPPLIAANFLLAVAFGYYMFKAGYAQVELLFYFLIFVTFLACWRLVEARTTRAALGLAAVSGALVAVCHLTKAAMLPFVGIVVLVCAAQALGAAWRLRGADAAERAAATGVALRRAGAALVFAAAFLAVMYPYIANSKRQFGHWFYNVNSTFYVWYDDWPSASIGTYKDGDGVGWPTTPPDQIPSMRTYLRDHSVARIVDRFGTGFVEMFTVSYIRLWYFKASVLYGLLAVLLIGAAPRAFLTRVQAQPAVFGFMLLYGLVYTAAVSFYHPISGTTLRMLLTHLAPLLFVVSLLSASAPFRDLQWRVAGVTITPAHVHLLILATILADVVFVQWHRLMADFAGY